MSTGFEQYGQCSGHWYESSAISVAGLGAIDHEPSLRHGVDQLEDVVADVGALVARGQRADDVVERALAVAQLEHLGRAGIQPHGTLGDQQHVLLAHLVVPQPRAGDEAAARYATGSRNCGSPPSI